MKTDKVDSAVIARFCKAQCTTLWVPPSLSEQTLKDLYRCRQNLLMDKNRITNRLESLMRKQDSIKIWKNLLSSIEAQIKEVDQQIANLLEAVFMNSHLLTPSTSESRPLSEQSSQKLPQKI